jgi:hypothetical protein
MIFNWLSGPTWTAISGQEVEPLHDAFTDSINVTDTVISGFGLDLYITDTIPLTESVGDALLLAVSNSATLDDTAIPDIYRDFDADTLFLTHEVSQVTNTTFPRTINDIFELTQELELSRDRIIVDAIGITDDLDTQIDPMLVDSLTLSHEVIAGRDNEISDTLSVTDSVTKGVRYPITDTLTLTDTITKAHNFSIADTLSLTDIGFKSSESVQDNLILTHLAQAQKPTELNIIDNIGTAEIVLVDLGLTLDVTDNISIADNLLPNYQDDLTLTDTVTRTNDLSIDVTDSIGVTDHGTLPYQFLITDNIGILDEIETDAVTSLYLEDTLTLGDAGSKSETATASNTLTVLDSGLGSRLYTNSLYLQDTVSVLLCKSPKHSLELTDYFERAADIYIASDTDLNMSDWANSYRTTYS